MIRQIRSELAYRLRKRLGFPTEELVLERLCRAGFKPQVAFDVGASYGIFVDQIWKLWPNAIVHCFEPEPEYVSLLQKRAESTTKLRICPVLVGSEASDDVPYHFHLGASSVLSSDTATQRLPVRNARMITLDEYCRAGAEKPDFLKIDVQGYELEVLRGAESILSSVEVVFTEVNHIEIYKGAPLAAELIEWLARRGYALHDICNFMPRPRDGALWQTDMLFVRHESALRASKEWGSAARQD